MTRADYQDKIEQAHLDHPRLLRLCRTRGCLRFADLFSLCRGCYLDALRGTWPNARCPTVGEVVWLFPDVKGKIVAVNGENLVLDYPEQPDISGYFGPSRAWVHWSQVERVRT